MTIVLDENQNRVELPTEEQDYSSQISSVRTSYESKESSLASYNSSISSLGSQVSTYSSRPRIIVNNSWGDYSGLSSYGRNVGIGYGTGGSGGTNVNFQLSYQFLRLWNNRLVEFSFGISLVDDFNTGTGCKIAVPLGSSDSGSNRQIDFYYTPMAIITPSHVAGSLYQFHNIANCAISLEADGTFQIVNDFAGSSQGLASACVYVVGYLTSSSYSAIY